MNTASPSFCDLPAVSWRQIQNLRATKALVGGRLESSLMTSTIQKMRKGRSHNNISLSDNDEPPQPDHINSVDVSQNIRSGEVVMANKELELKWLMAEGGEL